MHTQLPIHNKPQVHNSKPLPPLWLCILIDIIGMLSYLIPGMGEWLDTIWAPISAFLFIYLFGPLRISFIKNKTTDTLASVSCYIQALSPHRLYLTNLAVGKLEFATRELLGPIRVVGGHNDRHTRLTNTIKQLHDSPTRLGV